MHFPDETLGHSGGLRNIDVVRANLLGRPVDFPVVHSVHLLPNELREIEGATGLLLEGMQQTPALEQPWSILSARQYRHLVSAVLANENPLPIAYIDVEVTNSDISRVAGEAAAEALGLAAGAFLVRKTFVNAVQGHSRRAFLQGGMSGALLLQPFASLLSVAADYRPGSATGPVARSIAALEDRNPFDAKITMALRNRVFAFKSMVAAHFLTKGIAGDAVWSPPPLNARLRFPLLVGAAHTDVARHLKREPAILWDEIVRISQEQGLSRTLVDSAATVVLAKHSSAHNGWHVIAISKDSVL